MFSFETEIRGRVLIARVAGELDHHTAPSLRETLERAIEEADVVHVVLNLSSLSFMDSSGIGVILGRYKQLSAKGGRMVVCGLGPTVQRIFELSGLLKILTVAPSEEAALGALGVA
ncbi:MAG: anti-sigma F factor antagonist [Hydrogenibacillus sp.]|nr:anti-sigma F factor antagonist [Hydrogenibacillus sp.]